MDVSKSWAQSMRMLMCVVIWLQAGSRRVLTLQSCVVLCSAELGTLEIELQEHAVMSGAD